MPNILKNAGFESQLWTDMATGSTINQQPYQWELTYVPIGEKLRSAGAFAGVDEDPVFEIAETIPECIHKLNSQLPADEQLGGEDALVLDGDKTYKVFSSVRPFGVQLRQVVKDVPAGELWPNVPVQVHSHGDGSVGAAAYRICINDWCSEWYTFHAHFKDRTWFNVGGKIDHLGGDVDFRLQLESRALGGIDFFVDMAALEHVPVSAAEPELQNPCKPRVEYTRIYNVYPDTTKVRRDEICQIAADRQQTVGPSYDDAGLGNFGTAVLWDIPVNDREKFVAFYDEFYPGTEVVFAGIGVSPEPEPVPALHYRSLMGVHSLGEATVTEYLAEIAKHGTPPPVKAYGRSGDMAWLAKVKAIDPNIITIGRLSQGVDLTNVEGPGFDDPITSAQRVYNSCIAIWKAHPYVDYWEVINEQDPPGTDGHVRVAKFFEEMMRLVKPHNIKLGIFSYSMGVPEREQWDAIYTQTQCLQIAAAEGHVLALHEYGYLPQNKDYLLGRMDWLFQAHPDLKTAGLKVLVTEYNVDGNGRYGMEGISPDEWIQQIAAYDDLCRSLGYVLGVNIFTFGSIGASWPEFDPDKIKGTDGISCARRWVEYVINEFNEPPSGGSSNPEPAVPWNRDLTNELPVRTDVANFQNDTRGRGWVNSLSEVNGITIHHTAGEGWTPLVAAKDHINRDGGTQSIHYHIWIDRDGTVSLVAPLEWRLWHDGTWDYGKHLNRHIGVVMNGALHITPPTDPQLTSLKRVVDWLMAKFGLGRDAVAGHKDRSSTACPGWESDTSGNWKKRWLAIWGGTSRLTGLGVHFAPVYHAPVNPDWQIAKLKELGVQWVKLLHMNDSAMVAFARRLVQSGITPIVRIFNDRRVGRNPHLGAVSDMIAAGVEYFEPFNEPNIEWGGIDWHNQADVDMVASAWWADAKQIIAWGGKAAFPAMAPTDRGGVNDRLSGVEWARAIFNWMVRNHRAEAEAFLQQKQLWLAVHVSPFNKSFDYDPRRLWGTDDFCIRYYEVIQDWFDMAFGIIPVTISTEGGVYSPKHMQDLTFPVKNGFVVSDAGIVLYSENTWGVYLDSLEAWMRNRPNCIPICHWTWSDQGVADPSWHGCGWFDPDGNPRSPAI